MLPIILKKPELRCTARSRRSGWKQCGRLAAYGSFSSVCQYHGARKVPRFDDQAPNFKHGKRSLQSTVTNTHDIQRVRLLALGVKAMNGSEAAGKVFDQAWPVLLEQQESDLERLAKIKLGRKVLLARRKRATAPEFP